MLNHMALQGRFVEDPTFGTTSNGTEYVNFRLAWSEKYKEKETKLYLECKAFSGTASFMKNYMNKKGQEILAEGKLTTETWGDEGNKKSKIVMIVSSVHFCGKKQEGAAIAETAPAAAPAPETASVDTDELPF